MPSLSRFLLIAVTLIQPIIATRAATINWVNPNGGNWSNPANWSPAQVPGSSDNVIITTSGNYTVVLDVAATVRTLELGQWYGVNEAVLTGPQSIHILNGGSANEKGKLHCPTFLDGGTFHFNGTVASGSLTIGAVATLRLAGANGANYFSALNVINHGVVRHELSNVVSLNWNTITNNGTWEIESASNPQWQRSTTMPSPFHFANFGTVRKFAAGATFGFAIPLHNYGTVRVDGGTVYLFAATPNTNVLSGSIICDAGAVLEVQGTATDAGGICTGAGATRLGSSGTLVLRTNSVPGFRMSQGTLVLADTFQSAGTITNLVVEGSYLSGTNRVSGFFDIGGTLGGKMTVDPGGTLRCGGILNLQLDNKGTLQIGGSAISSVITNIGAMKLKDTLLQSEGASESVLVNKGVVSIENSQMRKISIFNNGLIEVTNGISRIQQNADLAFRGEINVSSNAELIVESGKYRDAGGQITGGGIARIVSGELTLHTNIVAGLGIEGGLLTLGPKFQNSGVITNLAIKNVSLLGTNRISGSALIDGGWMQSKLSVLTAGSLELRNTVLCSGVFNEGQLFFNGVNFRGGGDGSTNFLNHGTWTIGNGSRIEGSSMILVNHGTIKALSDHTTNDVVNHMSIRNHGVVEVGETIFRFYSFHQNTGVIDLKGGTFQEYDLGAGSNWSLFDGRLTGSGELLSGYISGGAISPGDTGIGSFHFRYGLRLGPDSSLVMDIGDTGGDQILVSEWPATLDGGSLALRASSPISGNKMITLIKSESRFATAGSLLNLSEGSAVQVGGSQFRITYQGGDGNDVMLIPANLPLQILVGSTFEGGLFTFQGIGLPNTSYLMRATTDFIAWETVSTATSGPAGLFLMVDPYVHSYPRRFYKIQQE